MVRQTLRPAIWVSFCIAEIHHEEANQTAYTLPISSYLTSVFTCLQHPLFLPASVFIKQESPSQEENFVTDGSLGPGMFVPKCGDTSNKTEQNP
jgi:hypothetical protein